MAEILVYVDDTDSNFILKDALEQSHHLHFTDSRTEAMQLLLQMRFDLIISRVFLKDQNMFEFLCEVKSTSGLKDIPFLCFVCIQTPIARTFNHCLAATARMLGACGYLQIENYCHDYAYDLTGIRQAVETYLGNKMAECGASG